MHGNAYEWCSDWYGDYPEYPTANPTGPESDSKRVVRGGSCTDGAQYCRSAYRDASTPGAFYTNMGFRVVLPVQSSPSISAQ